MSETTSQQVLNWARAQKGKQVRKGECWDLADAALRQAGAQSSADLGPMDDGAHFIVAARIAKNRAVVVLDPLQGPLHEPHGQGHLFEPRSIR